MVEYLESMHEEKRLDLTSAQEMFQKMNEKYPEEFQYYEIPHIASTVIHPLLKAELTSWQVLDAPFKYKETFAEWSQVLYLSGTVMGKLFLDLCKIKLLTNDNY